MHLVIRLIVLFAIVVPGAASRLSAAPSVAFGEPQILQESDSLLNGVSMDFDSSGNAHISYVNYSAGNIVQYAHFTGVSWVKESLPQLRTASSIPPTSIRLDSAGYPHIVCNGAGSDYAYKDAGGWHFESIAASVGSPSLRIGTDNKPRVAYYDSDLQAYRYAVRSGGVWSAETAAATVYHSGKIPWEACSIALDASNNPRIAYWDQDTDDLKYAYKSSGSWVRITLDSGADVVGVPNDIELDAGGNPHIVYSDYTANRVRHVWLEGGLWRWEDVTTDGYAYGGLDLDISVSGVLGIGTVIGGEIYYCRKVGAGGSWINEHTPGYSLSDSVGFAFNNGGSPFLAASGTGDIRPGNSLYYTAFVSGNWNRTLVDDGGTFGEYGTSLSHDGSWAAYGVSGAQQVRANSISGYGYGILDTGPGSYMYPSIDTKSDGTVYTSYYNSTDTSLRVAKGPYGPYFWNDWTTVDNSAAVGTYSSLRISAAGNIQVSYYDATNDRLRYAWNSSGVWNTQTVDSSANVGEFSALALNASGQPRVAYYDRTNQHLKFAYSTGSGAAWVAQTVDSSPGVGQWASLAYDSMNRPQIAYYDTTNNDLKYAKGPIGGWSIETVDSGSAGTTTGIATDSQSNPHISYYDTSAQDLKYAWFDGSAWRKQTLDSVGAVGWNTSIAINGNQITIAYYDISNRAVKSIQGYYDYSSPSTPVVTDDGQFTTSPSQLHATWTADDAESGIGGYQYAIGVSPSDPGSGYVVGWTDTPVNAVTRMGLALVNGQTYYFYVRAKNRAGGWSGVGVSDGIKAVQGAMRISDAKQLSDDTWVQLTGKIITRDASLYYTYIQEPDRSSAITVYKQGGGLSLDITKGDIVTVTGKMGHFLQRRCLYEPIVNITGATATPRPLHVRCRYVGGGPFMYVAGPPETGEKGYPGSVGLNNISLRTRITGRVTGVSVSSFTMNDGSRPDDITVMRATGALPDIGDLVEAIGFPGIGLFDSESWEKLD